MSDEHQPRAGDKFFDRNRFLSFGFQTNGFIRWVDWEEHEVLVEFYDGTMETYAFVSIEDCYEPALFGGCYLVGTLPNLLKRVVRC